MFHPCSLRSLLPSLCPPVSGASAPNSGNGRGALRPPEPSLPAGRKANRARGIWECMSAPGLNQGWMQGHKCCSSRDPDPGACDLHHFQGSPLALNQSHPPRPISHSWRCSGLLSFLILLSTSLFHFHVHHCLRGCFWKTNLTCKSSLFIICHPDCFLLTFSTLCFLNSLKFGLPITAI